MRLTSLLFLSLTFTAAVNSAYTPCDICVDRASRTTLANMRLNLYTGPTIENYSSVRIGDALELFDKMDNGKPTALYTFGFLGTADIPSTRAIINAYLARGDHNILLLDWHIISVNEVTYAIRSTEGVGFNLAVALNRLVERGLNTSGLNLIGHSLGGQICGFAGRYVNFRLPRITGLDPAGLGFYIANQRLSNGDAEFVMIIHTNRGVLGSPFQTGSVDFYPNGGFDVQPGCGIGLVICSHYRSCYYYAESVLYEDSFIGIACDSYVDFVAGLCDPNATAVMGYATPTSASGRLYLETNGESLYGRGEEGTRYQGMDFLDSLL